MCLLAKINNQPDWSSPVVIFFCSWNAQQGQAGDYNDDYFMDESRGRGDRRIQCLIKIGVSYAS